MKPFWYILCLCLGVLFLSCTEDSQKIGKNHSEQFYETREDSVSLEELCHPNKDTLLLWENGGFLDRRKSTRDYKALLFSYCHQNILTAKDIETLYPISVEEMNWFYSQLSSKDSFILERMSRIDTLMTLYADRDSLSCLPRFLNMYFIMDPQVIDREWMGDWNLNRVMYSIIPDNKQTFKSYYDTLDKKYDWLMREWLYAYQNF